MHAFRSLAAITLLGLLWLPSPALGGGTVVGWGGNNVGQSTPCASNVVAIAAGYEHSLLLKADGTVAACGAHYYVAGINYYEVPATAPTGLTNVIAVTGGDSHSLALKADGTVVAWGLSPDGQTNVPSDLTNVVAIASGSKHSLALKADGTVVSWGLNSDGQTNAPPGLTNVVAISGGGRHSLALKADGTAVGWGYFYQPLSLTNLLGLTNLVAISAADGLHGCCGYESWLALRADGVLIQQSVWTTNSSIILSNVVAISASRGNDHHISLALKADGTVTPVLGYYNFYASQGQPDVPPGLTNVIAVAAGDTHDLALVGDGPPVQQATLQNPAWGTNGFSVCVPTQNGRVYRLEYKQALSDTNWTSLPLVAGNGVLRTMNDPTATGDQRFYRVRRW